jgi:hypothetical protein
MENVLEDLRKQYIPLIVKPYFIFLVSFLILVVFYLLKGFVLSGEEPYFFYRISDFIVTNGIPSYDYLSFGGRFFLYPLGTPILLFILNQVSKISLNNLFVFTPFILGFLDLILVYLILRKFKVSRGTLGAICYFLLLSPPFLYISNYLGYNTIPFFLNLLAFYFVITKKQMLRLVSFLIYLTLPFFGFVHIFFGMILLLFYFLKYERLSKFIPFLMILLVTAIMNLKFLTKFGFGVVSYPIRDIIFAISGYYGFSIFLIFLFIFGMSLIWKNGKYKNNFFYLFVLVNILILSLNFKYIIYVNLIFVVIAAYGLRNIYEMKWNSLLIRNLTLMILISGIIFSGFSFIHENSDISPTPQLKKALEVLGDKTNPRDVIISHPNYGVYINSISNRKNFVDFNSAYAPQSDVRFFILNKLFYSKSLDFAIQSFDEFRITYILITPEMKNGLVWSRNNEGLLYLLNNNPDVFRLIYDEDGVEIWRIR